ncbi:3D domain-containing protein [Anaerosphaera multitolerans]|uniref:DUF348 domain-containing protein n=1 Tax=Anaerosphaera multitolerans TaxID=2487351 RepID=A0A437S8Z1_9FIRM|nr:3D domain-containing protein [Anaerosphaera multitolerans]RVU55580.1 DUF348 domain-containing protein [Anaerosphaera multitolerans]
MDISQGRFKRKLARILVVGTLLSSVVTMGFNTVLGKDVNLIIDGDTKEIITYSSTVDDFLKSEGIELKEGEVVTPSLETPITADMDIMISEPQEYVVREDLNYTIVNSTGRTVEEVLEEAKIPFNEEDILTPAVGVELEPSQTISIDRVEKESFTQEEAIPFKTVQKENSELYKGDTKVITKGVEGRKLNTVQNTFVNGELVSIDVLSSEVVSEPVDQVEEIGTKEAPSIKGLEGKKVKKVITMEATAYDPTAGDKTALGTKARVGAVAVDPKVIPLGTKLYVESLDGYSSYGYCVAEDTGGAIKGNKIDLFYNTHEKALDFGRRNVRVYVLED